MKLIVSIEGHRSSDLTDALREVLRLVEAGSRAGRDDNDTGLFSFGVEGVPVESYALRPRGQSDIFVPGEPRFPFVEDAIAARADDQVVVGLDEGGNFALEVSIYAQKS